MPEIVPLPHDYAAWPARDLRSAFPDVKGFSPRSLKCMRAFAEAWPDAAIVQQVLAQLPWYHQPARHRGHRAGSGGRSGVRAVCGAGVGLAVGDGGAFL